MSSPKGYELIHLKWLNENVQLNTTYTIFKTTRLNFFFGTVELPKQCCGW